MLHRRFFRPLLTLIALMSPLPLVSTANASPLLDVVVLMDASGSLSNQDYLIQKDLVSQLFNSFTVGPEANRFGLVQFGTVIQTLSPLTGIGTTLNNALNVASQLGGATNHGGAFAEAYAMLSSQGRGGNVQQVVVMLTDGNPNVSSSALPPIVDALTQSNLLKSQNTLVYTLGFGALVSPGLLADYASGPNGVFFSDTYLNGDIAINDLVAELNALPSPIIVSVDAPMPISLMLLGLAMLGWQRRRDSRRWVSALPA